MKVYFATHATTADNEARLASGWKDVELSEIGKKQAKELGERFKDITIDLVCCSDLKRAVDTVTIAFGDRLPVVVDKRLRETNYGDLNGALKGELDVVRPKEVFPNGESDEQAVEIVQSFYKELKEKYADKTILVVGHRATQWGLDVMTGKKTLEECVAEKFQWQSYWEYDI